MPAATLPKTISFPIVAFGANFKGSNVLSTSCYCCLTSRPATVPDLAALFRAVDSRATSLQIAIFGEGLDKLPEAPCLAQEGVGRERDDARGAGGSDFAQVRPEKRGFDHEVHGDEVLAAGER